MTDPKNHANLIWSVADLLRGDYKQSEYGKVQKKFMDTIVTRMDTNSDIFKRILDEDDLQEVVRDYYLKKVYAELRDAA